ncbi:MAG: hypothetical protein WA228_11555, partial [Desulfobaccales bacterium]
LLLGRLIGRVQFLLSSAFWCSFDGCIVTCIVGFFAGYFLANHLTIGILITLAIGWAFQTFLFQIAVQAKGGTLQRWRAAILSGVVILGDCFVASPLIVFWNWWVVVAIAVAGICLVLMEVRGPPIIKEYVKSVWESRKAPEYVKSFWETTKTQEFQAAFKERLKETIAEANKKITHAEFISGMENQTIGFKVIGGGAYQLLTGYRKSMFNILVMLYSVAPFILIPIWAYLEGNWWLIIGIIISLIATLSAAKLIYNEQKQISIGGFLLFICILCYFFGGIHNYFTFFALCGLWGFVFFCIADKAESDYLMQLLLENSDLFNNAIDQQKIMIVRRSDL